MLRVAQNKEEIRLREFPVVNRIVFSAFAVLLSVLFYISFSLNKDIFDKIWLVVTGIGAFIFLVRTLFNPVTTIKINKPGQTVSIRKQSPLTYSFMVYSFNEIADLIYVEARETGRGTKVYQLVMPLKSGEKIELSIAEGSERRQYFDAAMLLNSYIFDSSKRIPFKLTLFGDK